MLVVFALAACGAPAEAPVEEATPTEVPAEEVTEAEPTEAPAEEAMAEEKPHFSYEGETGPEYWGSLSEDWIACDEGMEQSPVDIVADVPVNADDVEYAYGETAVNIVNNGHAIQVNYDEGSMAVIDGTEYALQQFHFHSLSEHTVAGENMDMEMHLVHADADGNNAVVSVLLVEGAGTRPLPRCGTTCRPKRVTRSRSKAPWSTSLT